MMYLPLTALCTDFDRSFGAPNNTSFTTGDVADNFSQEMLAWYQDQAPEHPASTLV